MSTQARDAAAFQSFYDDTRNRLLLQTWALTGDLSAAQKAVRDAFVIAAHHWRKVRRRPAAAEGADQTREDWVRPIAWARAQRRHSVPHRKAKGVDPEIAETLAALGRLSITQRKVLVLAHLSSVSLEQLAREVGITKTRAEQELQSGTAQFSHHRNIPASSILAVFEPMAVVVGERAWPAAGRLSSLGVSRRRTHTLAGAVVAVAALVGTGFFAGHQPDSDPELDALSFQRLQDEEPAPAPQEAAYPLDGDDLLAPQEVARALKGRWRTDITSDNRRGGAVEVPCQPRRIADSDARAALLRTFAGPTRAVTAGQAVAVAPTPQRAKAAYARILDRYAACDEPRMQLINTERVTGVGDETTLVALHDWAGNRSIVLGTSRSGSVTTSIAATSAAAPRTALPRVRTLLQQAVRRTCRLPGGSACVRASKAAPIAPLPTGRRPDLLSEIDLPPATGVSRPWVGTRPERATGNTAATRCDNTSFTGGGISAAWTRTFVIPEARNLSRAFGLTETVGRFRSPAAASRFVAGVRNRVGGCSDRLLGSDVSPLGSTRTKSGETHLWNITVETSQTTSVTYLMAIVRQGEAVAQVGFVPSGRTTIPNVHFTGLVNRALERLRYA